MGSDLVPIGTNLWPPTDVQESQLIKQLLLFSSLVLQGGAVVHNSNTCYKFLVDISNMIKLELANGSFFPSTHTWGGTPHCGGRLVSPTLFLPKHSLLQPSSFREIAPTIHL